MKRRNQPQRSPHGKTSRNQGRTTENVLRSGKKWEDGGICKNKKNFTKSSKGIQESEREKKNGLGFDSRKVLSIKEKI